MRKLLSKAGGVACALTVAWLSTGCTTVLVSESRADERAAAMEREALVSAAADVSAAKWPKPESAPWSARLTGFIGSGERISENDAASAYLAILQSDPDPAGALFADAARQLGAADALVDAAAVARASMRPAMADVSILEQAIGDLRETRDIYLSCLKVLAKDGRGVSEADLRRLKSDFNSAIEDVGVAADELADSAAGNDSRTFAKPETRQNLRGTL